MCTQVRAALVTQCLDWGEAAGPACQATVALSKACESAWLLNTGSSLTACILSQQGYRYSKSIVDHAGPPCLTEPDRTQGASRLQCRAPWSQADPRVPHWGRVG